MTHSPTQDAIDFWHEAVDLGGLHLCRSVADLDRELVCKLARVLPGLDAALCVACDGDQVHRAQIVLGANCPFELGAVVDPENWLDPDLARFPLRYRSHNLGVLLVRASRTEDQDKLLTAILAHYGVALVNLTLSEESRRDTEHYCASLQALEEGIVLFQESDPEAISARLMGLATAMVKATAGALFVLEEVGNLESKLELTQTLGIPAPLVQGFRDAGGAEWPRNLLERPAFAEWRREQDPLGGLDPATIPDILHSMVAVPLCYHGVTAGICMLFNIDVQEEQAHEHLERVSSLGQLGAALLHRLYLEAIGMRNRAIETQLAIAETIQRRLLPRAAPGAKGLEFAWRSIAAQNIGGDYLDLLEGGDGKVCGLIADAAGHGINSALLMSSFRSTYRARAPQEEPGALLASLNDDVHHEVGSTGMFITAAALNIDPATREMVIANAGHNPILHYRSATGSVEQIDSHGPPLGFLPDQQFEGERRDLQVGDILILYTDGITEATQGDLDMFGEERLVQCLEANADLPAGRILEAALEELSDFTGGTTYQDDVSISVIKVV